MVDSIAGLFYGTFECRGGFAVNLIFPSKCDGSIVFWVVYFFVLVHNYALFSSWNDFQVFQPRDLMLVACEIECE